MTMRLMVFKLPSKHSPEFQCVSYHIASTLQISKILLDYQDFSEVSVL